MDLRAADENPSVDQGAEASEYWNNPLLPYRERRSTWGAEVVLGYSLYSPQDYVPNFVVNKTMSSYYTGAPNNLLELTVGPKRNFSFGSISLDFSGGTYSITSADGSTLSVTPVRIGTTLALDTLFSQPYVVPYGSVGAYTAIYREQVASQAVAGRTSIAPYFAFGLKFQLDWMDPKDETDDSETGLQSTYLFVEARDFTKTKDKNVDLGSPTSSPFQIGGGLYLEF